ncbi:unnamed protein product [Moneuplotes crassus]|uniref:Uncharacterized protein n=1 Tax=Euplotes crassus TaxID=5936 RepID=A0AAD1UE22_EUPCR|nr:unnamed protein product [Moneuplotes crassus]
MDETVLEVFCIGFLLFKILVSLGILSITVVTLVRRKYSIFLLEYPVVIIIVTPVIIMTCVSIGNIYIVINAYLNIIIEVYVGFCVFSFFQLLKNCLYFIHQISSLSEMYNQPSYNHDMKFNEERPQKEDHEYYYIFQAVQNRKPYRIPVNFTDRDPKYNKKRDKFMKESMLLDPIVRGNFISSYNSFDSLVDNPYVNYTPASNADAEELELMSFRDIESTNIGNYNRLNSSVQVETQQSPQISRIEQGGDVTKDCTGNLRVSSLMEPLLEQEEEEDEKSNRMNSSKNPASTCTSITLNSESAEPLSEFSDSLNPEDLFSTKFSPPQRAIDHCLISELRKIKIVPNLCCCFPVRKTLKTKPRIKSFICQSMAGIYCLWIVKPLLKIIEVISEKYIQEPFTVVVFRTMGFLVTIIGTYLILRYILTLNLGILKEYAIMKKFYLIKLFIIITMVQTSLFMLIIPDSEVSRNALYSIQLVELMFITYHTYQMYGS